MTSLTKIVGVAVHDNGALDLTSALFPKLENVWKKAYSQDALGPDQLDQVVHNRSLRVALAICLKVSQITNMSFGVRWPAVVLLERVEMRSSGGASVGVVTKLVDVHSTQGVGIVAGNLEVDNGRRRLVFLSEGDGSAHGGFSTDDSD